MIGRRRAAIRTGALALAAFLAGCQVIPKGPPPPPPPPPPPVSAIPSDGGHHRVALLVPLAGPQAGAGQAIANAAQMALLDMNADNLRITTYDTAPGVEAAASRAIADGAMLILGPLLGEDADNVARIAKRARVPAISYSNDVAAAGGGVFVMGNIPGEAIERVVAHARSQGASRFAALIPVGTYGERASNAMLAAVRAGGGSMVGMESYDRSGSNILAAARRLKARGAFDAVLIADGGRIAALAAPVLKAGAPGLRILGTELWSGDPVVVKTPALTGAEFAALSDARFARFAQSYRARFGAAPYRIATLGYDSVLLTLRIAREWRADAPFPTARMYDRGGFLGLDGAFRFGSDDVVDRALEVREVRAGTVRVISPAPDKFGD
ncbi:MAG: penicillin-binding protein activator [Sphingomonadales bacterium]|nr:penicillin-binding protein activator [Sphingomonadales bacterium]